MYLNKIILIGNLTKEPELKALPSGIKVCEFSVATNRAWKDTTGQKQEAVEYHSVKAFAKTAETIAQYCKKGDSIYVEGRLETRSWEKDGIKHYKTEVVAEMFQFGQKAKGNETKQEEPKVQQKSDEIVYPEQDINPDDIPFSSPQE